MNLYQLKTILRQPYIRYMRHKERHQTGFIKSALELHHYRPAFYRFIAATIENPDILHDAPITKDGVALDVGGYVGDWSARVYEKYGPRIYLFELDPTAVRKVGERFAGHPDIQCFDYGLARQNGELTLLQRGLGSTLYAGAAADQDRTVTVPVREVVGVLDELGLAEVDLMKLNIEGGEYDVLERLIEADRIRDVRCLMVQFHEWLDRSQIRRWRIRRALRKTHREAWNYPFIWEMWIRK